MRAAKRPSESRDAPRDRYGDFEVKREWWTGDVVPEVQVVRGEIAGMPHVQVIGLSKEKVEQALLDTVVEIRERLKGIKLSPRQRPSASGQVRAPVFHVVPHLGNRRAVDSNRPVPCQGAVESGHTIRSCR